MAGDVWGDTGKGTTSEDRTSTQVEEEEQSTWEQQEQGGCILWDTSASKSAALALLRNDVLAVLARVSQDGVPGACLSPTVVIASWKGRLCGAREPATRVPILATVCLSGSPFVVMSLASG